VSLSPAAFSTSAVVMFRQRRRRSRIPTVRTTGRARGRDQHDCGVGELDVLSRVKMLGVVGDVGRDLRITKHSQVESLESVQALSDSTGDFVPV